MAESATTTTKSLFLRAIPSPVVSFVRILRRLDPASRSVFAKVWLRRLIVRTSPLPAGLPASPRLLFVCHGNILRSAVAQALYQDRVARGAAPPGSRADSAGTAARGGDPADPRGIAAALSMGLGLEAHRSRRLTAESVERADLILVMDFLNEADVVARFPDAGGRVRLLGSFLSPDGQPQEIRDPYTGSPDDVRDSYRIIARAVDALLATLSLAGTQGSGNSR